MGLVQLSRRLILARHGQTDWNRDGRYQGHGNPPLNALGVEQAERLAGEVAALAPTLLATSDLLRARQTAAAIERRCGLTAVVDRALREIDLGTWEGLTEEVVAARHPDELRAWKAGRDVRRGGGETERQAGRRFVFALDRLLASAEPEAVTVVVAHGLVLRGAMTQLVADGRVALAGSAPHLGNGACVDLDVQT